MHSQCSKEQVLRLPSTTRDELNAKEAVENHQLLLHQEWSNYMTQNGEPSTAARVKNSTESWSSYETRKKKQQAFFELRERLAEKELVRNEAAKEASQAKSNSVIATMMAYDRDRLSKRTAPQHSLFIDFCKLQQQLFMHQIAALAASEQMIRAKLGEGENELMFAIVNMWHADNHLQHVRRNERLKEEQALQQEREQRELEQAEEAKRLEAERIAKERQDAEDEKERVEAEKRAERKRREEERRAKARVEREQRMSHDGPTENA